MMYSQKGIFEYLKANPLGVPVHIGDLEDMNGNDYIFLDYLTDRIIGWDDRGAYKTELQITVATKDFDNRKILTDYVRKYINVSTMFDKSLEFEYYISRNNALVVMFDGETERTETQTPED